MLVLRARFMLVLHARFMLVLHLLDIASAILEELRIRKKMIATFFSAWDDMMICEEKS